MSRQEARRIYEATERYLSAVRSPGALPVTTQKIQEAINLQRSIISVYGRF